jgi:acyl-CoA synthetase (AMP-forming)/AMP-acid ligase II
VLNCTIGALLERAAAAFGSGDALVSRHQSQRLSYGELQRQVDEAARGLLALGVQVGAAVLPVLAPLYKRCCTGSAVARLGHPQRCRVHDLEAAGQAQVTFSYSRLTSVRPQKGDRVAVWAPNCVEWVVLQYAVPKVNLSAGLSTNIPSMFLVVRVLLSALLGLQADAILVNLNPSLKAAGRSCVIQVVWARTEHSTRHHHTCCLPTLGPLRAELAYALNKVGVSALVMAPELKGTSFVDIAESVRCASSSCSPQWCCGKAVVGASARAQTATPTVLKWQSASHLSSVMCVTCDVCREQTPQLRHRVVLGTHAPHSMLSWQDLVWQGRGRGLQAELLRRQLHIRPGEAANIQFTSGGAARLLVDVYSSCACGLFLGAAWVTVARAGMCKLLPGAERSS